MKHLIFTLMVGFLVSCTSYEKKQVDIVHDEQNIDTININRNENVISEQSNRTIINLDTDFYLLAVRSAKDTISDYNRIRLGEFTYLKTGQTQFKYYVIAELKFYDTFKSYLIAADYESEQSCWIANYSAKNDLLAANEVYYDNAEGAWLTTSNIDQQNKVIHIATYDMYRTPEKKINSLKIDRHGNFLNDE